MIFWKSIKIYFLFIIVFCALNSLQAQPERYLIQRKAFHDNIDQKQKILDILDGRLDSIVAFRDPILTKKATHAYIQLVDSIQVIIEEKNTDGAISYGYLLKVFSILGKVNSNNYQFADYYENIFENISSIMKHKNEPDFMNYLMRDIQSSIANITFYKEMPEAETFLLKAANSYPNEVLKELNNYSTETYALKVIEEVAHVSPMSIKKYFNSQNVVNALITNSQDSVVQLIMNMYNTYGNGSKVFYFTDMIYNGEVSADLMNSVSKYPLTYLDALIKAKQKSNAIGAYDIERELAVKALEEVRKVNDLHDVADTSVRFAAVKNMGASELYTLIVYSPEEIFTSTFNGLYERLLFRMKNEGLNGYYLLEQAHFNKFRTFIKLCAGYNVLENFLSTMQNEQAVEVLKKFVSELNAEDGDVSEAVLVADTFGSLDNPEYLKIFEEYLRKEFLQSGQSKDTKALYGLLLKLLYQKMQISPDSTIALDLENYNIPPVEEIDVNSLTNKDGKIVQMHFFFDDEDGLTSYSTFLAAFKAAGFTVQEFEHYIILENKNKHATIIYANKPLSEREGQNQLIQMVQNGEIHPTVIVHRGHSYYAMNTISQIPPYAKVVFLGSCGGYHNISEVIHRAPQAHIIASKQIGTYVVNNTLLVELSKMIQNQEELYWANLWTDLDKKLKGSGKGYERFLDYVPPHKNMGAIFIQAYQKISDEQAGQ